MGTCPVACKEMPVLALQRRPASRDRGIGGCGPEENSIVAGGDGQGQRPLGCRMDDLLLVVLAASAVMHCNVYADRLTPVATRTHHARRLAAHRSYR